VRSDRYLKFILTLIAIELAWLGVRDTAPPVAAQARPTEVVVTGIQLGGQGYAALPVIVVGGQRPGAFTLGTQWPGVEPLRVNVGDPVRLDLRDPIVVQTGAKPLVVDVLPGKPSQRPGL
jgi:hypothetical protein